VTPSSGDTRFLVSTTSLSSEAWIFEDLRTPTETRNALRYVLMNTQKHYRVMGDRNFADPYSSAATFDGFTRAPATFEDATPWAWVRPRTWLLGVGWRTHGLLDPAEPPASSAVL
jgi:hypothetical protein